MYNFGNDAQKCWAFNYALTKHGRSGNETSVKRYNGVAVTPIQCDDIKLDDGEIMKVVKSESEEGFEIGDFIVITTNKDADNIFKSDDYVNDYEKYLSSISD